MSRFDERLDEHQIFNVLENISNCIKDFEYDNAELRDIDEVKRIEDATNYISKLLNNIDSHLVSINTLNDQQKSTECITEFRRYLNNINFGHLSNANNNLESALHTVKLIPYISDSLTSEQVRDDIISYRRSMGQHVTNVTNDINNVHQGLDELSNSIKKEIEYPTNQKE